MVSSSRDQILRTNKCDWFRTEPTIEWVLESKLPLREGVPHVQEEASATEEEDA